jgi:hypothetical protein
MNNPLRYVDPTGHVVLGEYNEPDRDLTYYMEHPEEEYWMSHNNISEAESLNFFITAATFSSPKAIASFGKEILINGLSSVGGYVFGEIVTGNSDEINMIDVNIAFVGGAVTPGGSGTGISRVLSGLLYSGTSSAIQECASQVLHGEDLSVDEIAVSGIVGAPAGVVGDLVGEEAGSLVEESIENTGRGALRAVSDEVFKLVTESAVGTFVETAFTTYVEPYVNSIFELFSKD